MHHDLKALVPEAKTAVAHGQMPDDMLEDIMFDFYEGHYNLLLCTSIIENGLDVANANTIIVYDADHFGLSQLYQMRGRVGRSDRLAPISPTGPRKSSAKLPKSGYGPLRNSRNWGRLQNRHARPGDPGSGQFTGGATA